MNEIEEHSVILYNEDKSLSLRVYYLGFDKESIIKDIRTRHTSKTSRWVQYKYVN